jgi:initiation factor 1A
MPPKKKKNNNTRNKMLKGIDIIYAESSLYQEYGIVNKSFGNCHFKVTNIHGEERIASLCGVIKKKCRVRIDDLVLMEPMSECDDSKFQIIFRYTQNQKKILEKEGRLKKVELEYKNEDNDEDDDIYFTKQQEKKQDETLDVNESFIDCI